MNSSEIIPRSKIIDGIDAIGYYSLLNLSYHSTNLEIEKL